MHLSSHACLNYLTFFLTIALTISTSISIDICSPNSTITRDVLIIGGGSSGVYASFQLRDAGKSILILEATSRLGGHTETYRDPITNLTADLGVMLLHDLPHVKSYFSRFNVSLVPRTAFSPHARIIYADFRTGEVVKDFKPPNPKEAFERYEAVLQKYPYLLKGYYLPDPVPDELLMPFGEFVEKYQLQDAIFTITRSNHGMGNMINQPALYVMKLFSQLILKGLRTGFLSTKNNNIGELYEKATEDLKGDVLFDSRVVKMDRVEQNGYAEVLVHTPEGTRLVRAKKILFTAPPTRENFRGWDLDKTESKVLYQFRAKGYYTTLIRNTGIPDDTGIFNVGSDTFANFPVMPAIYRVTTSGIPGLMDVKFGSETPMDEADVKRQILKSLQRLKKTGLKTSLGEGGVLEGFKSHAPFEMTVGIESIADGFYRKLYGLQGRRNTYYTGAAWHVHDSGRLWSFTEGVVQRMLKQ
ncbi:hypothetical protein FPQ18DRAFT_293187 [Pyronema domesticum]|nr:hypothetical protein FPQ18DRAFT_293187 [Pyronema domesticum]